MSELGATIPLVFRICISIKDAAFYSGYNIQYLRRMLRSGALSRFKIVQMWLIGIDALEAYLEHEKPYLAVVAVRGSFTDKARMPWREMLHFSASD